MSDETAHFHRRIAQLEAELAVSRAREAELVAKLAAKGNEGDAGAASKTPQQRMARCVHFGTDVGHNNECSTCKYVCIHQVPSSATLAFYEKQEGQKYDTFYCGCRSWN
jgi:hypothetical protein